MSKTALIDAVRHLDLRVATTLLDAKPGLVSVVDAQGRNLLHLACSIPCEKVHVSEATSAKRVSLLLDRGLEIDAAVGRDKCTALFFAVARARNGALIKLLLARGAKVMSAPGGGLYAAGWWNDVPHLKLLLDAGAEIDPPGGETPFLACWCWKRFDAAKYLVARGARINAQDPKGRTALYHSVEMEFDPALLAWLVAHGASPEMAARDGVSARLKASRKRDKRFLEAMGSGAKLSRGGSP